MNNVFKKLRILLDNAPILSLNDVSPSPKLSSFKSCTLKKCSYVVSFRVIYMYQGHSITVQGNAEAAPIRSSSSFSDCLGRRRGWPGWRAAQVTGPALSRRCNGWPQAAGPGPVPHWNAVDIPVPSGRSDSSRQICHPYPA